MINVEGQVQCSECSYCHDEGDFCWCSFWGLDEGECIVEEDWYCSNAQEKTEEGV